MLAVNQGCLKSITASTSELAIITDHYHILESFEPPPHPDKYEMEKQKCKIHFVGAISFWAPKMFWASKT